MDLIRLCLLPSLFIGTVMGLHCFACIGRKIEGDPKQCIDPPPYNNSYIIELCQEKQTYCKKKIVGAAGDVTVERRCSRTCNQQVGIHMAHDVSIDMYCCKGQLCNQATAATAGSYIILLLTATKAFLLLFLD